MYSVHMLQCYVSVGVCFRCWAVLEIVPQTSSPERRTSAETTSQVDSSSPTGPPPSISSLLYSNISLEEWVCPLKALSSPFVSSNIINDNLWLRHPSSLVFHVSGQFLLFTSVVCMLQLVRGTGSSVTVGSPCFCSMLKSEKSNSTCSTHGRRLSLTPAVIDW